MEKEGTRINEIDGKRSYTAGFILVLIYLLLEYGRPQDLFPSMAVLHLPMIIQVLLLVALFVKGKLFKFEKIQSKLFLGLIILMTLHVPIAVNNYFAFHIWKGMALSFLVFLSIINFVDSFRKIEKFIDLWIIINLVCAVVGIKNGGKFPDSAFMRDENDFALVMNMVIPIAYFVFLKTSSKGRKLFYLLAVGVFIVANITSFSRGGFIGLITVMLYCCLATHKKVLTIIAIIVMGGVLYFGASEKYWDRISTIRQENIEAGTGRERWYSWECGWKMFLDHPIIGVGQGNFGWNINRYEPAEGSGGRLLGGRVAHSLYITLISELGILGTILFMGLIIFPIKDLRLVLQSLKKYRHMKNYGAADQGSEGMQSLQKLRFIVLGIMGALIGYFVSGIFLSVLYYPHLWILLSLCTTLSHVGEKLLSKIDVPI